MRRKSYCLLIWSIVSVLSLLTRPARAETTAAANTLRSLGCPTVLSIEVVDQAVLCTGKPVRLRALVPSMPFGNWFWTKNGQKHGYDQQTFLDVDQSGVYSLAGDWENNPCFTGPTALTLSLTASAALPITLSPASVTFCAGETATLRAETGAFTGYSWLHDGVAVPQSTNKPTLVVRESGTYSLSGLAGTCATVQNQPVVQVNPRPLVSIVPSRTALCQGETAQLDAQTDPENRLRWQRDGTELGDVRSLTANTAATYSLTATRPGGCSETATYAFAPTVHPLPTFALSPVPATGLRPGESASTAPDLPTYRYQWAPADGVSDPTIARPLFSPAQSTQYTLTITSDAGCQYTGTLLVPVSLRLHFPSAFTPNGDGQNDTWAPVNFEHYPDAELLIYTRSGELIFTAKAGQPGFDGQRDGTPLPGGPYAYRLQIPGRQAEWRGTLLLVR